ncbi:hypothetical protein OsI_27121 [Oryza sativa Indica Group]|uniref:Uncharacterized protein n=1 Tax=Oryza sativa subsp. indica TaxID=39946 RepID=B8B5B0_ORYSI|nr:hypothetical protein OsI_27121 [Oryza sativa Indica Group]
MDSLNSDSSRKKLYGVQMLHSFLKKEQLRTKTITKLTNATKTVASLFDMLGWTSDGDEEIRFFAAKVTAELAGSLRVVQIPGATQLVASLLDTDHQQRIRDHFLLIDSQVGREDSPIQQVGVAEQDSPVLKYLKQMAIYCLIPVDEPSNTHQRNSQEEASTDQDFLPIQGLLILERLANFDPGNCMEISRTTGLISKMIDFISYRNHMTSTSEAHQIMLASLSLKVLRRLASTEGKLGVTLRQQILEHTFVLSNLAEIMDDNGSSHELKQLAAEILKNLAMDRNTSEGIGHIRVIISSLMREFLSQDPSSSRNSNHLLRKNAGQALAMLAMESTDNCLIMLMEPGYVFIRELTTMIHDDRYKCIAASLLWNMCEHAQPELSNSDLKELSYILREVLEGIMDVEGAELEVLIGLSSQICQVIPEDFTREVEHGQIKEKLVKRLVDVFNAHMKPSAHCPGIRRVIVQHAIYLMEFNSRYANDFHKCWMVEALSMVERTPSRSENYRLFSGDTGLMEHNAPLSALVARAKELMGREWRSRDHFLFIDSQVGREDSPIQQVGVAEQDSPVLKYLKQMAIYCLIPVDEPSNMHQRNSCMHRWWKRITKRWSLPEEEPSTDQDFLPIQGLLILERLANFDPGNCMEISRTTGLISKMIDFISYRNHMTSTSEAHQIMLASLSLKVLRRLASTEGKLGVTLRQQILEHTFVLSNLAEIMDDNGSSHELKQLAAEILKNLAMDRNTSEDIGHIRVIISSLMHEFLSQDPSSSRNSNHLLRKNAGQALAMLAMESTDNCLIMLMEPGYVFIRELTSMIHDDRYKCIAASLLWNMCEHAQPELSNSDLKELSYILREVLEGIMDAEGAELEVLIGLSSQICQVIPEDFTREVEHGQIKETLVKRLVDVLNAHMKPSAHCPGIRRVIVQHAIYLMEFNSRYANDFHKCWMVEALSMVERTPSRSENYRLFSGDTGLMEHNAPLSALVARAKELMGREWINNWQDIGMPKNGTKLRARTFGANTTLPAFGHENIREST